MKLYSYLLIFSFFLVGCQDKPQVQPQQQEEPTEVVSVIQDLIPYWNNSSRLWGFRNQKTDDVVIEPKYDEVGGFNEGISSVQIGQLWGFIDQKGKMIIEPKYDVVSGFNEGFSSVRIGQL